MPRRYAEWAFRKTKADTRGKADAGTVAKIQAEAKVAGTTLAHEGKGGLAPALALAVFRRDGWKCSVPGCKTAQTDLDLDHISGHAEEIAEDPEASKWLQEQAKKPKRDDMDSLHALCLRHHDMVHSRERAIENGNQPPKLAK